MFVHEKLILTQWDHCPGSVPMWPYKSKWPLIRRGCGHRSNVPGRSKNHNLWFNPQTQRPDAYLQRPVLCKEFLSWVSHFYFSCKRCALVYIFVFIQYSPVGFLGYSGSKNSACNSGDLDSIPELGRSPGEGHGNPLQYSCLESPTDRGRVRGGGHKQSTTRLSNEHFHTFIIAL